MVDEQLAIHGLTQTPRLISAPASANALAIAQPKPCEDHIHLQEHDNANCYASSSQAEQVSGRNDVTRLIVCDTRDESLLPCDMHCVI